MVLEGGDNPPPSLHASLFDLISAQRSTLSNYLLDNNNDIKCLAGQNMPPTD